MNIYRSHGFVVFPIVNEFSYHLYNSLSICLLACVWFSVNEKALCQHAQCLTFFSFSPVVCLSLIFNLGEMKFFFYSAFFIYLLISFASDGKNRSSFNQTNGRRFILPSVISCNEDFSSNSMQIIQDAFFRATHEIFQSIEFFTQALQAVN